MESIDRLRRYVSVSTGRWAGSAIDSLIDQVEREVERERVDAYTKGYDEGFASADDWAAQHEDAMAEHGWVRLPLDADGKPIRIGDVLECDGEEFPPVSALVLTTDGWHLSNVCITRAMGRPGQFTHHHAPTVEDVLREFGDGWNFASGLGQADSYIAKYAANLRLAGEDA